MKFQLHLGDHVNEFDAPEPALALDVDVGRGPPASRLVVPERDIVITFGRTTCCRCGKPLSLTLAGMYNVLRCACSWWKGDTETYYARASLRVEREGLLTDEDHIDRLMGNVLGAISKSDVEMTAELKAKLADRVKAWSEQ